MEKVICPNVIDIEVNGILDGKTLLSFNIGRKLQRSVKFSVPTCLKLVQSNERGIEQLFREAKILLHPHELEDMPTVRQTHQNSYFTYI